MIENISTICFKGRAARSQEELINGYPFRGFIFGYDDLNFLPIFPIQAIQVFFACII